MSAHACSVDQLFEQSTIELFITLGWATAPALKEIFGHYRGSLSVYAFSAR